MSMGLLPAKLVVNWSYPNWMHLAHLALCGLASGALEGTCCALNHVGLPAVSILRVPCHTAAGQVQNVRKVGFYWMYIDLIPLYSQNILDQITVSQGPFYFTVRWSWGFLGPVLQGQRSVWTSAALGPNAADVFPIVPTALLCSHDTADLQTMLTCFNYSYSIDSRL